MCNNIETVEYIQLPLSAYVEIQSHLPNRLAAIKSLRNSQANISRGKTKFHLTRCKLIVDFIQYHPDELFSNSKVVLVPSSVLL